MANEIVRLAYHDWVEAMLELEKEVKAGALLYPVAVDWREPARQHMRDIRTKLQVAQDILEVAVAESWE